MESIVAIASGNTNAGVCIIRISGENAFEIAQKCLVEKNISKMEERKMYLCNLNFSSVQDKGLVVKFVAPFSFTGENIVELHLHGGQKLAQCAVDYLVSSGARIATAGEFTKRAFLNGKISLESAESIIELINSESQAELNASYNIMIGKLKEQILEVQNSLTNVIAEIEVVLDYPEEDIDFKTEKDVLEALNNAEKSIQELIDSSKTGQIIKNGIQVAIIGKPNVGKSSLLNAMLNFEKAIVTNIEGTTRDVIEGTYEFRGVKFSLFDTAGIRESNNEVERIGISRSKQILEMSDVILLLIDSSQELTKEDKDVIDLTKSYANKPLILIENKVDLLSSQKRINKEMFADFKNFEIMQISAKANKNIETLKEKIFNLVINNGINPNSLYVTNARHLECLNNAIKYIKIAKNNVGNISLDCVSIDIKNAWNFLGEITGKYVTDEVVDAVFSKFCLGK